MFLDYLLHHLLICALINLILIWSYSYFAVINHSRNCNIPFLIWCYLIIFWLHTCMIKYCNNISCLQLCIIILRNLKWNLINWCHHISRITIHIFNHCIYLPTWYKWSIDPSTYHQIFHVDHIDLLQMLQRCNFLQVFSQRIQNLSGWHIEEN